MRWWSEKQFRSLKDITRTDGYGWKTFAELLRLRRTSVTPPLYARVVNNIPWDAHPKPAPNIGQWIASKEEDGTISTVYHLHSITPLEAKRYQKDETKLLHPKEPNHLLPDEPMEEVCVLQCGGPKRIVLDYNPQEDSEPEHSHWLWGNAWISNMEWDPKEWQWRNWVSYPTHPS